ESNFLVGRFTHAAEGFDMHDGAAYLVAISDQASGAALYTTWAQMGAQMDARSWSNDDGWSHSQGDYAQLAVATLAGIYRLTGSTEAKAAYEALIADGAPFSSSADFAHDPTFAIAGPEASAGKPVPIPDSPTAAAHTPNPTNPTVQAPSGDTVSLAVGIGAESRNGSQIAGDEVTVKGVDQHLAPSLLTAPDDSFSFGAQPAGGTGAGTPDVLRAPASQEADQGDAHFLQLVDGVQVGEDLVGDQASADAHVATVGLDGVDPHANAAMLHNADAVFPF
ncbi:MAG: hypothetical protein JWR00_165, partial [Rubritepida sp.]|nr:hypothetical protein [Rubritepida sp.]